MNLNRLFNVNTLLWLVYIALLAVLLPHTAWAFSQFEPSGSEALGWVAAFAFEAAIFGLTVRLKERLEATPRYTSGNITWRRFKFQLLNSYTLMLTFALSVSVASNWAHAVQFGRAFQVFSQYSISPLLYSVMFGAILPVTSMVFSRVLADTKADDEPNAEVEALKADRTRLKAESRQLTAHVQSLQQQMVGAEQMMKIAAGGDKSARVLAVHEQWPLLANSAIAVIAECSASHVSGVLKEVANGH